MSNKRQSISLSEKLKIIEDHEKTGSEKLTIEQIAEKHGLKNRANVYRIINNKIKIREKAQQVDVTRLDQIKSLKTATFPQLDKALMIWIGEMRNANWPVTGMMIEEQAIYYAGLLELDFQGSHSYVTRFAKRNTIKFGELTGEGASVSQEAVDSWKQMIPGIMSRYDPEDIYNADETGLFWRLLPNKTFKLKNDENLGIKNSKERVTVLLITNMTGTDRHFAVVGKSNSPRGFKKNLPFWYYSQQSAWMDLIIFEKIMNKLNEIMKKKKKKILLILDNFSAHFCSSFSNIEFCFLPANTTAKTQPLDQGIINSFKANYRKKMLRLFLTKLRSDINIKMTEIKLIDAIHMISTSWCDVKETVIFKCFQKAGLKIQEENNLSEANDNNCEIDDIWKEIEAFDDIHYQSFSDYVCCDDSLACGKKLNDNEIINLVKSEFKEKSKTTIEMAEPSDKESDSEVEEIEAECPTFCQVLDSICLIRRFATIKGISNDHQAALSNLEDQVFSLSENHKKQAKITDYFVKNN